MKTTVVRVISACLKVILALALFVLCTLIVDWILDTLQIDRKIYQGVSCACANLLTIGVLWLFWQFDRQKEEFIFFNKTSKDKVVSVFFVALGLAGIVVVYMIAADYISDYLNSLKENLDHYRESVNRYSEVPQQKVPLWDSILYIVTTCTLVPFCEEFLFRGIIMGKMRMIMPGGVAVLVQAVIFGLMHGITVHIGYALICGIVIGSVYLYCNDLKMPVIMHAVFNFLGSAFPSLLALEQFGIASSVRSDIRYALTLIECMLMVPSSIAFVYLWYRYKRAKEEKEKEQDAGDAALNTQEVSSC